MSFKMEVLENMLDSSEYDPVIWEDVKPLQEKVDNVESEHNQLLDDFYELIEILMNGPDLPNQLKETLKTRYGTKQ